MSQTLDALRLISEGDEYDRLPKCVKAIYTREQWTWTPRREKDTLVDTICQPECEP